MQGTYELDLIREALGMPNEPVEGMCERIRTLRQTEMLAVEVARIRRSRGQNPVGLRPQEQPPAWVGA